MFDCLGLLGPLSINLLILSHYGPRIWSPNRALKILMATFLEDTPYDAYSYRHMVEKLESHFGEEIIFTQINGVPNVVTFQTRAKKLGV